MATISQPRTLSQPSGPVERVTDCLETSSLDDRSYRVVRLPNQLEVLLVHDANTDEAGAAMDVNVGSFSDPNIIPGLAHGLEHVLFMGTKKYPIENDYNNYLSMHSGRANASTKATSTNYYFKVAANCADDAGGGLSPLYGALDRFAQFFIEPLFLPSTLDRELRAVDSENKKNLQSDLYRLGQLDKSLSNPKHPYCRFTAGNLETLKVSPAAKGLNIRQEIMNFFEKEYSANRMKLVVLGKEPLDILEEWVADLFSGVKNKNLPQNRWENEHPLGKEELLTIYFAKPIMASRSLNLDFPFMNEEKHFGSQPSHYITHLINHEGPGSITSYIKLKGWADHLGAAAIWLCPGSLKTFRCRIRLTEEGLKHYRDIVKVFFQYVSLLKETPPQEWVFKEQKCMADVDFQFQQKISASMFTSSTSAEMQFPLPREGLLSGYSRLRKFDAEAIKAGLEYLRPDNFRMSIVSQDFPGDWDQVERWYGTEYKYEKIPQNFLAEVREVSMLSENRLSELHLPKQNPFIPTKLEVERKDVKESAKAPRLIRNDNFARAWFKKDDTFWVPKANLFIRCRNPLPGATAENALKTRVYTIMVRDALEEYSYDAESAGLEYSVSAYPTGLDIELSGYNDKLPVLLERVLLTMRDLEIRPDRFEIIKERLFREMRNWDYQPPHNQVGAFALWLSNEKGFINDQLLAKLPQLAAEDIQSYYPQLLKQMHFETLVHGNFYKEDALRVTKLVESILRPCPLPHAQWPVSRSLIFPPGGDFVYRRTLKDRQNVNNCIEYFLYIGEKAVRPLRVKALLLDQMTHELAFDQLRTKEQLGYVVRSGARMCATTFGYHIVIQSERTPEYLETRIDAFLIGCGKLMREMSNSDFEAHKMSVITNMLEKMMNLDQESNSHWAHIESECFDFELEHHDADHIKALTKNDMIEFFEHYISPPSPARSKLSVHLNAQGVSGTPTPGEGPCGAPIDPSVDTIGFQAHPVERRKAYVIENVQDFKSLLGVSTGPQPVKALSEFEVLD